jgi:hypothetical protein
MRWPVSEGLERPFAHLYETGGMRRVHLRRHTNILKRLVIYSQSELSTEGTRGYDPFPGD